MARADGHGSSGETWSEIGRPLSSEIMLRIIGMRVLPPTTRILSICCQVIRASCITISQMALDFSTSGAASASKSSRVKSILMLLPL